jgi:hypothetical protein
MKRQAMVAIVAAVMMIGGQGATSPASANAVLPVVVGAAAGATVGALLWPAMVPAGAVTAGTAVVVSPWGWAAFMTTRAAVGAVIGAGLGYLVGH